MKRPRKLAPDLDIVAWLGGLPLHLREAAVALLGATERDALDRAWPGWAHEGQRPPDGTWDTWILKAGRGFGKTLAGAQWITARIAEHADARPSLRIALVGATLDDARRVMVEGQSGLLNVAGDWVRAWHPSLRKLHFTTGAEATLFSGASPDMLRGPEHHYAWCDELAKWERGKDCWDQLQFGLRLGAHPQVLVTTTPKAGPVLRAIIAEKGSKTSGGSTRANPHISPAYKARVHALYAGTRLGRQELEGELLPDAAGALWTVELLERCRLSIPPRAPLGEGDRRIAAVEGPSPEGEGFPSASLRAPPSALRAATSPSKLGEDFTRTLVAVDPPSGDGTCGIIACARDTSGVAHVLADHSVTARTPQGWAEAVATAAAAYATREVVAEANQGGKMVQAVLLAADPRLHVRLVTARHGKSTRAEPVAHLFEAGRVVLHSRFPELEAELLGMIAGGGYEGPGTSPDRADAMIWGVGEVMREREARIRGL